MVVTRTPLMPNSIVSLPRRSVPGLNPMAYTDGENVIDSSGVRPARVEWGRRALWEPIHRVSPARN